MTKSPWVAKIQSALCELANEYDPSVPETTFIFHPLYRVGVSEKSSKNIEQIFGESLLGRFRNYSGNLKKMDWLKYVGRTFKVRLPSDSIIFFRDDKEGVIIASHERQIVLKMFFSESHIGLLEEEIRALQSFEGTAFSPYVPKLLNHGRTSNGGQWLVTSFCSNTKALTNHQDHEKFILKNFSTIVMPAMTEFYKAYDPKVSPIDTWIKEALVRTENHPSRKKLTILIKKIALQAKKHHEYEVVESQIHHDLHAGNILIDEKQTVIIDWEGRVRGLVLIDILDFSRRFLQRHFYERMLFNLFMRGLLRKPPELVQRSFEYYQNWAWSNFRANIPMGSERLSFMIYAVERALILHEKRLVDRFKDKRGIEFNILKAIK